MEVEDAERDVGERRVKTKKKENAAAVDVNNNSNKHATFQASAVMYVRSALFWVVG